MSNEKPLVSVVCLCCNQSPYVASSLESVIHQTYERLQLVVVDDGSNDGSKEIIAQTINNWSEHFQSQTTFLSLSENQGNCRAFNKGLSKCQGEYVIDLAADDIMSPLRIEEQVRHFETLGPQYGVTYTDAEYIDTIGQSLGLHKVPDPVEGDVYSEVVRRYFIPPPTMMMRKKVFEKLGGYDEGLVYEDFDFWIRSARDYQYGYLAQPLTRIRKTPGSLSSKFYDPRSPLAESTFQVCLKIAKLNRTETEDSALIIRIRYERMQCILLGKKKLARKYAVLQSGSRNWQDILMDIMTALPIGWRWLMGLRQSMR